jgi:two-component system LytT family response regulator
MVLIKEQKLSLTFHLLKFKIYQMLRTVIIDDEKSGREVIMNLLSLCCRNVTVVAEADGVKTGIETIQSFKPDLVMLDIQMPDGTGFDLLKKLTTVDFKLIFITAYEEHAIKAFQYSAIDYILKPISAEHLIAAVNKVEGILERESTNLKVSALLNNLNSGSKEIKKIVLKTAERIYAVDPIDIIRCESDGSYTQFYLNDGKKILVSRQLKEFDEILAGGTFIRVHQSHLINFKYFDYFEKSEDMVVMKDKSSIPVATRKKETLLKLIDGM